MRWQGGLVFPPAAWPAESGRRAVIVARPGPVTKVWSPATSAPNSTGSARRTGTSGGGKDFLRLAAAHFAKEQLPPRSFA
jgi:hypothetical protein